MGNPPHKGRDLICASPHEECIQIELILQIQKVLKSDQSLWKSGLIQLCKQVNLIDQSSATKEPLMADSVKKVLTTKDEVLTDVMTDLP